MITPHIVGIILRFPKNNNIKSHFGLLKQKFEDITRPGLRPALITLDDILEGPKARNHDKEKKGASGAVIFGKYEGLYA